MPALLAGRRIDLPLFNGHLWQMLFNGNRVFLPPAERIVSVRVVQADSAPLPDSLPIDGTLTLGAIATYADGHDGDLTTEATFTVRDTSVATINGNTLVWAHGGVAVITATIDGITGPASTIQCAYAPEQIVVDPSEVSLRVGGEPVELSVRVLPAEADQTVTVSVEPEGIVEVTPLENPPGGA